jgi:hypothetical protein
MNGHFCSRCLVFAVLGPHSEDEVCGLGVVSGRGSALAGAQLSRPLGGVREG